MRCSREIFGHDLTNALFGLMDAWVGLMGKFAVCSGQSKQFRLECQVSGFRFKSKFKFKNKFRVRSYELLGYWVIGLLSY